MIFLPAVSKEEAIKLIMQNFINYKLAEEEIDTKNAEGRVTSRSIFAKISSPHSLVAAMDGIAVNSETTHFASPTNPIFLEENKDFVYINTGEIIPPVYNAVIKIEEVFPVTDKKIKILASVVPWQNVRLVGEDITTKDLLLPPNHKISPVDICALLSCAVFKVYVYKKPRVIIFPTGDEVISPEEFNINNITSNKIIDANSYMLRSLLIKENIEVIIKNILADDKEQIKEAIHSAINKDKADMVLIIAGSSVGTKDYTYQALKESGRLIFTAVRLMPGKPTLLAEINNRPVFGIPGYPVSAYLATEEFVKPLLLSWQKITPPKKPTLQAKTCQKITSKLGVEEHLRVNLGFIDNEYVVTKRKGGAGIITSLSRADAILPLEEYSEGIDENSYVEVKLIRDIEQIKNNIIIIGSHDLTLDILRSLLKEKFYTQNIELSIINVGSLGGLYALARGECHLTTAHLLDEESGEYNVPFIKKIFKDKEVVQIKLVKRAQGLLVNKNNPKNITSLKDLTREDVFFINRQRGAGTRILLDYLLKKEKISPAQIKGYELEVYTHTEVAAAIKNNIADVGLGIKASACAFQLDFIEIAQEDYDIITFPARLKDERIKSLLRVINSFEFKHYIEELGGYQTDRLGEVIFIKSALQ